VHLRLFTPPVVDSESELRITCISHIGILILNDLAPAATAASSQQPAQSSEPSLVQLVLVLVLVRGWPFE
jgi:hypothetical protein